jgi:hypothetical protein
MLTSMSTGAMSVFSRCSRACIPAPTRAAPARELAGDLDPRTGQAFAKAVSDKDWSVRAAAVEAIAKRGGSGPAGEHRACNVRQERYCALFCRRCGSSVEPDHARKWDPVTLKAAAGTCHVRRWIRDHDCSKALVRRHWRSGSLTSRCNRELEAMVAG